MMKTFYFQGTTYSKTNPLEPVCVVKEEEEHEDESDMVIIYKYSMCYTFFL